MARFFSFSASNLALISECGTARSLSSRFVNRLNSLAWAFVEILLAPDFGISGRIKASGNCNFPREQPPTLNNGRRRNCAVTSNTTAQPLTVFTGACSSDG